MIFELFWHIRIKKKQNKKDERSDPVIFTQKKISHKFMFNNVAVKRDFYI
jgi:hypothetical protein